MVDFVAKGIIVKLAPDKITHLKYGVPLAALVAGIGLVAVHISIGFAVAAGSLAIGVGMELNQKLRNEGKPEALDALASGAAGIIAGLLYEAAMRL